MDLLAKAVQHPLFGFVSLVLAIFGIVLTIRSRRTRRPTWAMRSNNLITDYSIVLPELDIRFGSQKIANLTISKVLFWNAGSETIDRNDVAETDPIRIEIVGSAELLNVSVLKVNSTPTRFAVARDPRGKAAYLSFDFLDREQGACLQVIHTGTGSTDLTVIGTIKGAGQPTKREITVVKSTRANNWLDVLSVLFLGLMVLYALIRAIFAATRGDAIGLAVILPIVAFFCVVFYAARQSRRVPRGLEVYRED